MVKTDISAAVADVTVALDCSPTVEGWLEVVASDGDKTSLLHSKKYGMGYVDTPEKKQHIVDGLLALGAVSA